MKAGFYTAVLGTASVLLFCADLAPQRVGFVAEAQAVVGLPGTPVSVAGVARRTAVRTTAVVATAATTSAAAQQQAAAAQQQAAAAQQQAALAQQQQAAAAAAAAAAQPAVPPPASPPPAAAGQPLPLGTIVSVLPAGCVSMPIGGVEYHYCGGNFYRAAFQGNNVVYVTAKP